MRLFRVFPRIAALIVLCGFFPHFAPLSWAAPMNMPASIPQAPGQAVLQTLLNDIGKQRAEVIAIQRELVARPALNPEDGGEGEEAKARWIEEYLLQKGLPQAERIDVPDERVPAKVRPNLIIRYPGASERTLWIVGHLDTSPPGDLSQWTGSPWALRIVGDTIYGRGVEDNHQAITSGLILMESMARNRVTPPLSFGLVLHASGKYFFSGTYGLAAMLAVRPDLFKPGDLVVVPDQGNYEGSDLLVGEKGLLWLKITVTGKQVHSAFPYRGVNALDAGGSLIADLRGLHQRFAEKNALFDPPTSTFVPTAMISGNPQVNQIPGEFVFHMDCRLLLPYTADEVQGAVRTLADAAEKRDNVTITVERKYTIPTTPVTPPDALVVQAVRRAVLAELKVTAKPIGTGGATVAGELRAKGIPVLVWANVEGTGLAANEHITVTKLLEASRIFARILFDPEVANAPAWSAAGNTPQQGTGK
ncbi:Peptidase M20 [uncultured delta proteobacterium]|uniref:Peptidase M20 n=1 Tax=uncultured delta proteobacterium TaxID=34034 RepID=A0A212KFX9_9DELT|nr:Peptidase M20 [uncultured delta proteobacterium]